jgi:signal transduction histidine kinase
VKRSPATRAEVIALIGVLGTLVGGTLLARHRAGDLLALDVAAGIAGWLAAPLALWRPVSGTLGLTLLAALSPAATPPATFGAVQVAQRHGGRTAVAVAAAGVAAHAVQGLWRPNEGISFGWWMLLVNLAYGALVAWGARIRARRALVEALRERARRAEAEQGRRVAEARMLERTMIAREMHDVLAHRLSLLATYAGALEYRPDAPPEKLAHAAGVVRAGVHQALDELRDVIVVLRDGDTGGAGDRPQPLLSDVPRLVGEAREAGGEIRLRNGVDGAGEPPPAVGRTAYRVVQEALTNARKHAAGRPVAVLLDGRPGDGLTIDVRNPLPDRDGPAPPPLAPGSGTGLVGLTERVRLAGGRLDHGTAGGEFRLEAWLPWPA